MQLPNIELDPLLLTAVCEYAHEHGLSATDCIDEAIADWVLAVARGASIPKSAGLERKSGPRDIAQVTSAGTMSISG